MSNFESRVASVIREVLQPYLYDGGFEGENPKRVLGSLLQQFDPETQELWDLLIKKVTDTIKEKDNCEVECEDVQEVITEFWRSVSVAQSRGLLRPVSFVC